MKSSGVHYSWYMMYTFIYYVNVYIFFKHKLKEDVYNTISKFLFLRVLYIMYYIVH